MPMGAGAVFLARGTKCGCISNSHFVFSCSQSHPTFRPSLPHIPSAKGNARPRPGDERHVLATEPSTRTNVEVCVCARYIPCGVDTLADVNTCIMQRYRAQHEYSEYVIAF